MALTDVAGYYVRSSATGTTVIVSVGPEVTREKRSALRSALELAMNDRAKVEVDFVPNVPSIGMFVAWVNIPSDLDDATRENIYVTVQRTIQECGFQLRTEDKFDDEAGSIEP